jgi:hypothetical protein
MFSGPSKDIIIIFALMSCIEIRKWLIFNPNVPEDTKISGAHKLLAECIEAVTCLCQIFCTLEVPKLLTDMQFEHFF